MKPTSEVILQRALRAHELGRLDEAAALYRQAINQNPLDDISFHNLGLIQSSRYDYASASSNIAKSIEINPGQASYRSNYANVLRSMGRTLEAIEEAEEAIRLNKKLAAPWNNKGLAEMDLGRDDQAANSFKRALALDPRYVEALTNLALLMNRQRQNLEAASIALSALKINPRHLQAALALGDAEYGQGNLAKAMDIYRQAASIAPSHPDPLIRIGRVQSEQGDGVAARQSAERAVTLAPDSPHAHFEFGQCLRLYGFLEEAAEQFRIALRLSPNFLPAYAALAHTARFESVDAAEVAAMRQMRTDVPVGSPSRALLAFGLGEVFDSLGEHRQAFEYFGEGNEIRRKSSAYSPDQVIDRVNATKDVFNSEFLGRNADRGDPTMAPVFVLGMPRSGTTLTEQIILASGEAFGAGEINLVNTAAAHTFGISITSDVGRLAEKGPALDFAKAGRTYLDTLTERARAWPRFTDKMPDNFWHIGLIHLMFPNCKIVYLKRSPMDNCLSIFKASFIGNAHEYSYDLVELGHYYNLHLTLMQHWRSVLPGRFFELEYETLVADPEASTKKLYDYLDLTWAPSVLDFHKSKRDIRTSSVAQVRKPIYKTSVNLSERYGELLDPLRAALDEWQG